MALYDWNVCLAAVFFEVLGYTEVLLRNAIDAQFQPLVHADLAANTWLHDPNILMPRAREQVADAEQRIQLEGKTATRGRVVANLTFGFWRALTNKSYKQLWISHLHQAFPNGNGNRTQPATILARLNPFRNRLAHHDPILSAAVRDRHDDLIDLAGLIDADAAGWINDRSCVLKILDWKPPLNRRRRRLAWAGLSPQTVHFHAHRD